MNHTQLTELCLYAKSFSQLNEERIAFLHDIQPDIQTYLPEVTQQFYRHLDNIPRTTPFLEGRLERLQKAHHHWLEELFSSSFDETYTQKLYKVGDIHVQVKLPVEFMVGGS